MKKILLLLSLCSFLIVPVLAQKSSWTPKDRSDFAGACVDAAKAGMSEDSAKYYCSCMLKIIEEKYPDPADAATIEESEFSSPEWMKIIQGCLVSYWTPAQRKDFMASCVKAAIPVNWVEKANSKCDCMMYKIERRYHNYAEASKMSKEKNQSPEWKRIIQSCLE